MHVHGVKCNKFDACRSNCQAKALALGKTGCCEARKDGYCIYYPEGKIIRGFPNSKAVFCSSKLTTY